MIRAEAETRLPRYSEPSDICQASVEVLPDYLVDRDTMEMQVLEMRKRVLREEHPDALTSMNNLAHTRRGASTRKPLS